MGRISSFECYVEMVETETQTYFLHRYFMAKVTQFWWVALTLDLIGWSDLSDIAYPRDHVWNPKKLTPYTQQGLRCNETPGANKALAPAPTSLPVVHLHSCSSSVSRHPFFRTVETTEQILLLLPSYRPSVCLLTAQFPASSTISLPEYSIAKNLLRLLCFSPT